MAAETMFPNFKHRLYCHVDAFADEDQTRRFGKRLTATLSMIAARGRPSIVKGCTDEKNRGWLRTPLGGQNGMHYYLWWMPSSESRVSSHGRPEHSVIVRAIRHHDNHDQLATGAADDYLEYIHNDLNDPSYLLQPWSAEQTKFLEGTNLVRVIKGRPGSGKTAALWRAMEQLGSGTAYYLTWSRQLAESARRHLDSFLPASLHTITSDFTQFLSDLLRRDVHRPSAGESRRTFEQALNHIPETELGSWAGKLDAIYSETRAYAIGHSVAGEALQPRAEGISFLSPSAYKSLRGGREGLGNQAANEYAGFERNLMMRLDDAHAFPDLRAASEALKNLRQGSVTLIPGGLDYLIIDEVQDLTPLELQVVIEFCKAQKSFQQRHVAVLIAGDEGQTVRPTGFDWTRVNSTLARELDNPLSLSLDESFRCPEKIDAVIDRAATYYKDQAKASRPRKQTSRLPSGSVDGQLFHVATEDKGLATRVIKELLSRPFSCVVALSELDTDWLSESDKEAVLTPFDAKGLEYETVCILNPGRTVFELDVTREQVLRPALI